MDLREAIQNDFDKRRGRNARYSLRAYANLLGVPVSSLSEVLNGKRAISQSLGEKIIPQLQLAPEEERSLTKKLPRTRRAVPKFEPLILEDFEFFQHWYYFGILSVCGLDNFDGTDESVAQRLGLEAQTSNTAIAKLLEYGLLERDKNSKLVNRHREFTVGQNIPSAVLQKSQESHLELSYAPLKTVAREKRDFSYMNIPTDPARIKQAKIRIHNFRRRLSGYLGDASIKTTVYRLGIQLFPLSKDPETTPTD